jgi:hypothetical protein
MAILTVGYGKTYSTIAAANSAASAGDTLQIFPKGIDGFGVYIENIGITNALNIVGVGNIFWAGSPPLNLSSHTSGTLYIENINITWLANNTTWSSAGGLWFNRCSINISANNSYLWPNNAAVPLFRITNSIVFSSTTRNYPFLTYAAITEFFNNTFVLDVTNSGRILYQEAAQVVRCANNIMLGTSANASSYETPGSANLKADFNIESAAIPVGANSISRTALTAGLAFATKTTAGWHRDFRTIKSYEVAGTTTIDGVDITALCPTDIDGRTRTTWARGCSEGYLIYDASLIPDPTVVLNTATTGGVQGRWTPATAAKYQSGETYGVDGNSETGTLEVKDLTFAEEAARNTDPGENNVRWQTTYKIINANKEGNVFLPDESEVLSGIGYDSNAERTGTLMSISNPGENNVREGVAYGGGGIVFYGNLIVPTSGEVQAGVNYDTNGSITGTYDPLGTAPSAPVFGTVTVSGTTATVPLTAGNPADKIYLRYRSFPSGAWSAQSETLSRTGSGNITLAGLSVGRYELAAYALNIQYSAPSVPTLITVQPTAQPIFDQLVDAVAAMIDDLNLVTADNTAYTVSTAWPPEWSNKSTPTIFVTQGSIRARPMMGGAQERDLTVEIILCERGDDDSLVANRDRNIEAIQTAIITTPRPVNLVWIDAEPLGETHAYDPDDVLQYNIMSAFSATYHTRSN